MRPPFSPPRRQVWTLSDGYRLEGRVWPPTGVRRPRAILYLHGIQSHGGWYEWSASFLARTGAAVLLPDRRGSGLNWEARGDVPSADRWLADLDDLAHWCRQEWEATGLGLVGVSWGGKPALLWTVRNPGLVTDLLLIAPGFFPRLGPGPLQRVAIVTALAMRRHAYFPIPLRDPALFTDNPAGQEFIRRDPLKLESGTARLMYASFVLDRRLARLRPGELRVPTTLLLAGRDRIILNSATERWLRALSGGTARIEPFPQEAHTLEFSARPEGFLAALEAWRDGMLARA